MLHNRQRIAPRYLALELRGKYASKALSEIELQAALSALKLTGIPDLATRLMDDSARFALDQLLEDL